MEKNPKSLCMGYCFSTDIRSAITNMIPGHMLYAQAHALTEDTLFNVLFPNN